MAKANTARNKVPPVAPRHAGGFDTSAEKIGQDREAMIALEGPAVIDRDDIQIVSGPRFKDKAETEAFMAQMLTILIYPSSDKYPENPVPITVNGRNCFVFRNQPTLIKRCYVERLARARNEGITQDPGNPNPEVANKLTITSGLRYPFNVLKDPSPIGQEWLQAIFAEA